MFEMDSPIYKFDFTKQEIRLPKLEQFCLIQKQTFCQNLLQFMKDLCNSKIKLLIFIQQELGSDDIQSETQPCSEINCKNNTNQTQIIHQPFNYQIHQDNFINKVEQCYAFEFNDDSSILFVGCENPKILIYEFKLGRLKQQIQALNEHTHSVLYLKFLTKSKELISGDNGGFIFVWQNLNTCIWNCKQKIRGHIMWLQSLVLNKNQDLMISSGGDQTLKFWIQKSQWILEQTIEENNTCVRSLSLNVQENKVITCGSNKVIFVIEHSKESKKWMIIQRITVDCEGYRICYINDYLFIFQPLLGQLMHVFETNRINQQFAQTKDIVVNEGNEFGGLFPMQYFQSKQLLVNKHYNYVNLMRVTEDGDFKVEQSIPFGTCYLYGGMIGDGQYLFTWDHLSKQIQIRNQKQNENYFIITYIVLDNLQFQKQQLLFLLQIKFFHQIYLHQYQFYQLFILFFIKMS
ncbi:unnamed protein product [Paramecium octaurelia]|uniref:WD40-repeat-containing domain n=1 Tax=Paramecium octaurelia TaxID=43137 RepID=A0A8S1YKI2_PAROT|nr:unnamed protein product [Paramecium octaurelia]